MHLANLSITIDKIHKQNKDMYDVEENLRTHIRKAKKGFFKTLDSRLDSLGVALDLAKELGFGDRYVGLLNVIYDIQDGLFNKIKTYAKPRMDDDLEIAQNTADMLWASIQSHGGNLSESQVYEPYHDALLQKIKNNAQPRYNNQLEIANETADQLWESVQNHGGDLTEIQIYQPFQDANQTRVQIGLVPI